MNLLDLFSGIGAFSLGLERSGAFRTVAFCENDPFCRRVLAKHWPEVPCYDDVRSLTAERLEADGISVDAICGGFPCTDISVAGKGAGITGPQSRLWSEFARIIGEVGPRYVFVENVSALLGRGLGTVLGDLAALGFDAEWHCIPASAAGAPHQRDRVWIVAHTAQLFRDGREFYREYTARQIPEFGNCSGATVVAHTIGEGLEERAYLAGHATDECTTAERGGPLRDAGRLTPARHRRIVGAIGKSDWWLAEPDVGRVAHGVPARVDRLKSLGNSLVPQIAELIGRAVAAQHKERAA